MNLLFRNIVFTLSVNSELVRSALYSFIKFINCIRTAHIEHLINQLLIFLNFQIILIFIALYNYNRLFRARTIIILLNINYFRQCVVNLDIFVFTEFLT